MKVIVLGGVAAGTKAAAKLMREDRENEVIILNKGENISYAGCGLPYFIGNVIPGKDQLIVNTPQKFEKLTGAKVLIRTEATKVDREGKTVTAVNLETGEEKVYQYDKLVIATGASPVIPPVEGSELQNVFTMRTPEDAIRIKDLAVNGGIKKAVVVGAGYIGLELAENLAAEGIRPFVVDMAPQILPGFDPEVSDYLERKIADAGIPVVTGVKVTALEGDGKVEKVATDKRAYKADMVVFCAGIRPNTEFLEGTGIEMFKGTIITDSQGRTNDKDIYGAGDCAMVRNAITGKPAWSPMGSTANISGRLIAQNITGEERLYRGVLGTAVCKLPGLNAGRTGLTQAQALEEGFDAVSVIAVVDDKAHYMPGASYFIIKMIADKKTLRLLGIQAVGSGAVDKIVDMAVTAIMCKADLNDLADMDLAYAPPFSTAIHPFVHTLNILLNKLNGDLKSMTPVEFASGKGEGYKLVDAGQVPSVTGAMHVELTEVDGPVEGLDKADHILLVCNRGKRAYLLQNRLDYYGYKHTKVLEGGITFTEVESL
ncbi:FAD-dependent oxidoreductase [Clostridium boliviensis]|uniref:FAD-dependent oxidoreductase n=1 Tax=Clostridium boliviensis TaxID=318465 RepID=A0ABU4GUX2_9CLOT|nr:FAD-dependent oxidoreductase [Clostridium boliviensis]MDW2800022.1 FAD-dependent oxidoreductase [Clostridium boliviensis]